MSVKKLIFSAVSSILFLQFVVPLLGIDAVVSVVGTANILVVAVFCVSTAGLIAEGCCSLISAGKKLSLHKPELTHAQSALEPTPTVASVQSENPHINAKSEVPTTAETSGSVPSKQSKGKQSKNHVDVLLGKEVVA